MAKLITLLVFPLLAQPVPAVDESAKQPATVAAERELRVWSDSTGKFQVSAELVDYQGGKVTLLREDEKTIVVPFARLSGKDQDFVRAEVRKRDAARPKPARDPENEGPPNQKAEAVDRGLGILPLERPVRFVHVEGAPPAKPEDTVRCRWSDAGKDPKLLVEIERERLKNAGQSHAAWEQKTGLQLVRVETHHLVVHAQLPAAQAREVGLALETLKNHLQRLTGNMALTPLRPDKDEMIVAFGKPSYLQLVKALEQEYKDRLGQSWGLVRDGHGSSIGHLMFFYQRESSPHPPAHMALSLAGSQTMRIATNNHQPGWLTQGFSAYCEWAVMRKNHVRIFEYRVNNVKLDSNWSVAGRQLALAGVLKPWEEMLTRKIRDYEPIHYIQSYAMASYLLRSDPQQFLDFLEALRDGATPREALEKAYHMPLETLEAKWRQWLVQRKP